MKSSVKCIACFARESCFSCAIQWEIKNDSVSITIQHVSLVCPDPIQYGSKMSPEKLAGPHNYFSVQTEFCDLQSSRQACCLAHLSLSWMLMMTCYALLFITTKGKYTSNRDCWQWTQSWGDQDVQFHLYSSQGNDLYVTISVELYSGLKPQVGRYFMLCSSMHNVGISLS